MKEERVGNCEVEIRAKAIDEKPIDDGTGLLGAQLWLSLGDKAAETSLRLRIGITYLVRVDSASIAVGSDAV
jgi:hypothetical protein